eukprot:TRINITY_DN1181_c0_g1_i1.p1 TRINITY_DN1181_c0_g1~~TRINITY_DN1181_c0_g1_i1.p1  ORF type:complete len:743 (-),score=160.71 TRINITY_DN1181_c0_g1_i1:49-2277(-)
MKIFLVFLLLLSSGVFAQTSQIFAADFIVSEDPTISGILTGKIYYDGNAKKIRNDYDIGPIEVFNFTGTSIGIRYLGCGGGSTCNAETWKVPMPIYWVESGDTLQSGSPITSVDGRTCQRYTKAGTKLLKTIWVDSNSRICRAQFRDPANTNADGKVIDFQNVRAIGTTNLDIYKTWSCPQQTCSKMMDIALVFDQSGSIKSSSFTKEKNFGVGIAQAFKFGPTAAAMTVIMFANSAERIVPFNIDQTSVINQINGITQAGGETCIGCGISLATTEFNARGRPGATKIMIVLTDGENNRQTSSFESVVNSAKDSGITIFAIGVGGYNQNQIEFIASDIDGVQTVFTAEDFNGLAAILQNFVIATCLDIPGNPCGSGCLGFCACNQQCLCPNCDDGDACTDDACVVGANGNGCTHTAKNCEDGDLCTINTCNSASGCSSAPNPCNGGNQCTVSSCDSAAGCQYKPKDCNDGSPCTNDTCVNNFPGGCKYTNVTCDLCIYPTIKTCDPVSCYVVECNPADRSCVQTPVACHDNNECTEDTCNPATGHCEFTPIPCDDSDKCAKVSCDPEYGCVSTPFDIPNECNDYDVCTVDTCNSTSGCVNTPMVCDDGDACTTDTCNSITGCQYLTRECALELPASECTSIGCNPKSGCYLYGVDQLIQPECGKCKDDGPCPDVGLIAGLSVGAIVGISIAAVGAFAIFGAVGGKAGYAAYMRNKGNMSGAQTSPLYQDNGMSGTNPFFEKN